MINCSWHSFFSLLAKPRSLALCAWAIAALLVALASAGSAQAALLKSYDFDGNYSDTLGNGVDLIPLGGSIAGGRYSFLDNQGLKLTSALPSTTDYAIEFRFRVEEANVTNYNKLIDFQEGTEVDPGLYQYTGGLYFYSGGPSGGTVLANTDYTVGLARAGGTLEVYLDGVLIGGPYVDATNQAVSGTNVLDFFKDDNNSSESFPGSVDFIRIHNDSSTFGLAPELEPAPSSSGLPEPSSLTLLGLGALGLIRARRRKHLLPAPAKN